MERPDVDVGVIYTHEDCFMPRLLETLAASAENRRSRLILVDNVSDRGTEAWESIVPETLVVRNEHRLGYGPNLNRILAASTARYALLLNTDMYFPEDERFLDAMVDFMDAHPDCGVSGCRLYHEDGTYGHPARRFLTLRMIAARRMGGLSKVLSSEEGRLLYEDRDPTDVFECDWLSGCLLMIRREAFQEVGGLDEGFAKYFEDVDYCARMAAAGWKVMFNGATYGYHLEQRASKQLLSRDAWTHLKSYVYWLRKWGFDPASTIERRRAVAVGTAPETEASRRAA